jgi:hypothetical protein
VDKAMVLIIFVLIWGTRGAGGIFCSNSDPSYLSSHLVWTWLYGTGIDFGPDSFPSPNEIVMPFVEEARATISTDRTKGFLYDGFQKQSGKWFAGLYELDFRTGQPFAVGDNDFFWIC